MTDTLATPQRIRGRGRPSLGDAALVQTAFRFTAEQLAWLDRESELAGRIGRNAVLRRLVDAARQQAERSDR